ncbi:ATP phosphoribosyltransferase [Candidatus Vidania fulgoroideorum]
MLIGISKGRIFNILKKIFKKNKLNIESLNTRKLILKTNNKKINIIPIKSEDSKMLMKKYINACIIGSDMKNEIIKNNYKYKRLNFFKCKLSLICKKDFFSIKKIYTNKDVIVCTKYINISKKFLGKKYILKKMLGSVESSLLIGISDCIVDIIQTGETICVNNMFEVEEIMDIYPLIIYKKKKKELKYICKKCLI